MLNRIAKDQAHLSLHRYFFMADTMRLHLDKLLLKKGRKDRDRLHIHVYRSLWYGMLFVVVEGVDRLKSRTAA